MCRDSSTRRPVPLLPPLLLCAAAALGGGCYEHVVKEKGLGANAREIYEPNVELMSDKADPWGAKKKSSDPGIRSWKDAGKTQSKSKQQKAWD